MQIPKRPRFYGRFFLHSDWESAKNAPPKQAVFPARGKVWLNISELHPRGGKTFGGTFFCIVPGGIRILPVENLK